MIMAPIELPEKKLVKLQNNLANITKLDIAHVRRAFNAANIDDAQYYSDRFDWAKVRHDCFGISGTIAGAATVISAAAAGLPLAVTFGVVTAAAVVLTKTCGSLQQHYRDMITKKVAAVQKAPEL